MIDLETKLAAELAKRDREHAMKRIAEIDRQITKLQREREKLMQETSHAE